jgi:hypothetical protein
MIDPRRTSMKKAPLSSVLVLLLLSAVTGCSRYYWSKPGASAEQFTQDSQACVRQAAVTMPSGASLEAVEQYYRACLNHRGYARDKQVDPPPPGSYRGIENGEEFGAAVEAAMAQGARPGFEPELARLDDLKARGRITEDEYATMRRRLVEGVTPGALTPAPPAGAATAAHSLAGRWYGRDRAILEIRGAGRQLEWEWEQVTDRATTRASGTGSVNGERVSLVGRSTGLGFGSSLQPLTLSLTWDGRVLRGTWTGANNLPRGVEFRRDRP